MPWPSCSSPPWRPSCSTGVRGPPAESSAWPCSTTSKGLSRPAATPLGYHSLATYQARLRARQRISIPEAHDRTRVRRCSALRSPAATACRLYQHTRRFGSFTDRRTPQIIPVREIGGTPPRRYCLQTAATIAAPLHVVDGRLPAGPHLDRLTQARAVHSLRRNHLWEKWNGAVHDVSTSLAAHTRHIRLHYVYIGRRSGERCCGAGFAFARTGCISASEGWVGTVPRRHRQPIFSLDPDKRRRVQLSAVQR